MSQKVALVTGAATGVGKAIAQKLLSQGYQVAIGYNRTKPTGLDKETKAFPIKIDVGNPNEVAQAIQQITDRWGKIDILVNNAGIAQRKNFLELAEEDWNQMFSVNLLGAVRCAKAVLPAMIKNNFGRIINISSVGGQWGGVHQVHYAASKAAMINLTMSLAKLYSAQGITSNCVSLGVVDTEMIKEELPKGAEELKNFYSKIPVGRIGKPDEVAAAVAYLASEDASFVTGQTLNLNGGVYFG